MVVVSKPRMPIRRNSRKRPDTLVRDGEHAPIRICCEPVCEPKDRAITGVVAEKKWLVILKCFLAAYRYSVLWRVRRRVSAIGCVSPAIAFRRSVNTRSEASAADPGGNWIGAPWAMSGRVSKARLKASGRVFMDSPCGAKLKLVLWLPSSFPMSTRQCDLSSECKRQFTTLISP